MVWDFMLSVCYVGYKAMQSVPTAFIEHLKSLFICCSFNIMLFKNTPSLSEWCMWMLPGLKALVKNNL